MTTQSAAHSIDSTLTSLDFIWLEITEKCNLTCSHCYADSSPHGELFGKMEYEDWRRVVNQASALGCRRLQFIGGEPTLHPQLNDMIDHANQRGFELIEVFTNATRIGTNLLGCFQRNHVQVATSFYSDEPTIHEKITHGAGSWQRTVDGIRHILSAGLSLRVGVIETEQNTGHGQRAINFVKNLGVTSVGMDRERGVGRGRFLNAKGSEERYEELCGQCWKGRLCVTSAGEVFPCVFSRQTPLGSAKQPLAEILESSKLNHFRGKVRDLEMARTRNSADPCWPDGCAPQVCAPILPCQPQMACNPDSICSPNIKCQPDV